MMRPLVAQEPGRADLRVDLAISYWNLSRLAEPEEIGLWLEQVLETQRPLREWGLLHGQLNELWGMATAALRKLDDSS